MNLAYADARRAGLVAAKARVPAKPAPLIQAKLRIGAANDPLEREADRAADAVMRGDSVGAMASAPPTAQRACAGCAAATDKEDMVQRKCAACESAERGHEGGGGEAAASAVAGGGTPLSPDLRAYFEPRFGRDFSDVRVHTDPRAARAASAIGARAYTLGPHVAFGAGEFAPGGHEGRRLIAHELAHVAQQGGSPSAVRRTPVSIRPAGYIGPLQVDERRAAASCDISCGGASIGTFHAMPMMFTNSGAAPPLATSAGANGVSISMHFIRNANVLGATNPCLSCTRFNVIQVVDTSYPAVAARGNSYVDNAQRTTPFYNDVYQQGAGVHTVDPRFPGAGDQVNTTRSVYDHPARPDAGLAAANPGNLYWNGEACVTCERPGRDLVLGCITYGFRRTWNAATSTHGPVQVVGPGCLASPSTHFVSTVRGDPTTSSYDFET